MAETRLTHDPSDLASNCFVCEPGNGQGLQLEIFHDDEREVVTAELRLGEAFSGTPRVVHGGVTLAVLDELQSWAVVALAGKDADAVRTRVEFREPVDVGATYTAEAEVVSVSDEVVETVGRILDESGDVHVEGVSTYYVRDPDDGG